MADDSAAALQPDTVLAAASSPSAPAHFAVDDRLPPGASLVGASLAAADASSAVTLSWRRYVADVELGRDAAQTRHQLMAAMAQHAYAWAVHCSNTAPADGLPVPVPVVGDHG